MPQHWTNLVVVLLIVGSSVVSMIFRKLQEQAVLRQREKEREQRELETLRTGRAAGGTPAPNAPRPVPASDTADLQGLAQRRAEQLRQLREMQAAKSRAAAGGAGRPRADVIVSVPGSAGPTVPGTRATPRPPAPIPARARVENSGARTERASIEQRRARAAERARLEAVRIRETEALNAPVGESTTRRLTIDTPPLPALKPVAPRERVGVLGLLSVTDWKRAVMTREVLGPPVSLRSDPF